jgi:uncharacterized protein (TIGR00297 family)
MMIRALAGLALAASISFAARAARALTLGGAVAATMIGTLAVAAGWGWGVVLVLYFVSSTLLSRLGRSIKEQRTSPIVEKGGDRDAIQVLANGGIFAGASIAMLVHPDVHWVALGIGSLATASADTWSTEIGTLYGGEPRSILSWRRLPTGTSGGITAIGTLGGVAGAIFVAILAWLLGWMIPFALRIALAGVAGALADSFLGATVQARRWCDSCQRETERVTHDCGTSTRPAHGLSWLDNDVVNFLSNATGGLLAALLV